MEFADEGTQAQTQEQLVDFVRSELQLARAGVRSASNARDAGHVEEYKYAKAGAEKAIASVARLIDRIQDEQVRSDIAQVTTELERLIRTI